MRRLVFVVPLLLSSLCCRYTNRCRVFIASTEKEDDRYRGSRHGQYRGQYAF
jgi:hypothetical protein